MNDREALIELLELWRATKNPEVARAVDAVSARITRFLPAIAVGQKQEVHRRWVEIAAKGDPCDLGRLLDHAVVRAAGSPMAAIARVRDLSKWAIDPRIARFLCDLLTDPPNGLLQAREHWEEAVAIVTRTGDPRSAKALVNPRLRQLVRSLVPQFDHAVARLEAIAVKPLDDADAAQVAACLEETDDERIERAHLEAIAAAPDDDDVRLVYADWLQSKGDPRGEFIALQCALARGSKDERARDRAHKLLVRHREVWLGDVARIVDRRRAVFARGFLESCRTHAFLGPGSTLAPIASDRRWWTVRSLSCEAELGVDPVLLRGIDPRALRRLVLSPYLLRHLGDRTFPRVRTLVVSAGFDHVTQNLLAEGRPFPAIETLAVRHHGATIGWLHDAPITGRLAFLSVATEDVGSLAAFARPFDRRLRTLEIATVAARYVLTRDEEGSIVACEVRARASVRILVPRRIEAWISNLVTLPSALRRFTMTVDRGPLTDDEHERLQGVLSTYRALEKCELPPANVLCKPPPPRDHELPD